jgi:predicted nucleotidyltransferase component of viral defense system
MGTHIDINANKSTTTSGGYFGLATLRTNNYPPINIEININSHDRENVQGEIDSISNNFVPTYTLCHLPQKDLVNEKVFLALMQRGKPRDYYDLYIIMRTGMLSSEQKIQLGKIAREIIDDSKNIDFQEELGTFLPMNQQSIIRDFPKTLEREMQNQLSLNR